MCEHKNIKAQAKVIALTDANGKVYAHKAKFRVACIDCGAEGIFSGISTGIVEGKPHLSINGTELELPFKLE